MIDAVSAESPEVNECRDIRWPLRYLTLAGQHWPAVRSSDAGGHQPPVVALHGWLDNSQSFARLAPEITEFADLFAVDLPGHGLSDHHPAGQGYLLVDYVAHLAELLESHFESPVDLVSHSLGGIISILFAAAFPEKVRRVVMIDSIGPISRPPEELTAQLRRGIRKRLSGSGQLTVYRDLESAVRVRAEGMIPLSPEAARTLIPRNMRAVDGGFVWRTDPRLRHPSLTMFDEEQVLALLASVTTPTLFVQAHDGLMAKREGGHDRVRAIHTLTRVVVPGGHHCHLEGDISVVANEIRKFLTDEN